VIVNIKDKLWYPLGASCGPLVGQSIRSLFVEISPIILIKRENNEEPNSLFQELQPIVTNPTVFAKSGMNKTSR
jgi:hypothetical protein